MKLKWKRLFKDDDCLMAKTSFFDYFASGHNIDGKMHYYCTVFLSQKIKYLDDKDELRCFCDEIAGFDKEYKSIVLAQKRAEKHWEKFVKKITG